MDITKVIVPAAGLGTRFLPYTKSIPKEMLPLGNKPAMHWIVAEALSAGIKNFSVITSRSKTALENHFDADLGLEAALKEKNKLELISSLEKIARAARFTYIRQPEPLGLGHAVWMAKHTIGKEYFGIMLPDEIFIAEQPVMKQLAEIARQQRATVVAVHEVPMEKVSSYGIIGIKKQITPKLFQVANLIEKPKQQDAQSNLAIVGRYIVSHKLFDSLADLSTYAEGELQLTDGISHMLQEGERVFAYKINGIRHDIGNPLGWAKAVIDIALQNPRYAPQIQAFLKDRII